MPDPDPGPEPGPDPDPDPDPDPEPDPVPGPDPELDTGATVSVAADEVDEASVVDPAKAAVTAYVPEANWLAPSEHAPTPPPSVTEHNGPVGPFTVAEPEVEGDTETVKTSELSDPSVTVGDESPSPVVVADLPKFVEITL